ncbi:tetrathionate reductase subunit TtrC [Citrobacter amalonaticus]|uniref:Tetrathionate reductase subunit TtrC n=1 Tax=Citrobacter amalonaticus TaxID=35703 RepID=A0A2S4RYX7_CITAM|nr:tetrathionate reductase subunit TtrC [Citrobacter amalonaticus]POT57540.1 tetrathionate reductase subunit TtrC [Citrobacter amalonaticus]POT76933.1 tetrathionate reductase subunit TtrC [Citrobacter amalonaticus]POU66011.1 tetrathionate reductase subunit TtrC [Citrobacter amalonaticus]POV06168.1 tetrathionate reductase subunit TtrC [Citrobacter amalonaticus]
MTHSLIIEEVLTRPQEVSWLPWAVQYFFFIGIAACATLFACVLHWRKNQNDALQNLTLLIALTCAITAPLALTADLHQTARVWHFYAYPTPWSWMPWGALFLPLFTLFLGLWFLAQMIKRLTGKSDNVTRWLALASALSAVGLLVYTGREVSVVQARPIWFSYAFPVVMFFSALQTFFALLILGIRDDFRLQRQLARWQLSALAILAVVVAIWVSGDTLSGSAIRQWLALSSSARHYAIGWLAFWLIALIFCLLALRYPLRLPVRIVLACSAMTLCWLMRWTLLIQVQTIPKFNAQFNPYTLPAGTDGWLAILGTFGLWIALLIIVRETVSELARRMQHG